MQSDVPLMPLEKWLLGLVTLHPTAASILAFVSMCVLLGLLMRLESLHSMVPPQTYITPFVFLLFCSAFPLQKCMSGAHVASLLFIISLFFFCRLYKDKEDKKIKRNIFYAGMFISLATLFSAPSIFLMILVPISLLLFRNYFSWKEHIIAFAGVATPLFYTFIAYYFLYDDGTQFFVLLYNSLFSLSALIFENARPIEWMYLGFLVFLMIQAIPMALKGLFTSKMKVKKIHTLLLWAFFVLLIISLFLPSGSMFLMPLLAIPSSILVGNYFIITKRRRWAGWQFFILLALTFLTQYF
ncbi:hypothetical protein AGMMS4956_02780 [Bacteroidia bacterium]|nr:hypothetical protein AGMMS4956_02780 [Bacteroidia bacterium]